MADKTISELIAATNITQSDLFVLEQNNVAKKLTGQTLINDLLAALDGHGGIYSIEKTGTVGLTDTYTITFADTTTATFEVVNGKSISTAEVNDSYQLVLTFNDGTSYTSGSIRGQTGTNFYGYVKYSARQPQADADMTDTPNDWMGMYFGNSATAPTSYSAYSWYKIKGDSQYVHIKYAAQEPTADSQMHDTPDAWIGVYSGTSSAAPTAYTSYSWYKFKGDGNYTHIRYAAQEPTADSQIGTTPDAWIGIYCGISATAPTTYTSYTWYQFKGDKGDTGDNLTITGQVRDYQSSTNGTDIPSGTWTSEIPTVLPGNYLWARTRVTYSDDVTVASYSVSRMGIDGTGSPATIEVPLADGDVAAIGISSKFARADHVHPRENLFLIDSITSSKYEISVENGRLRYEEV